MKKSLLILISLVTLATLEICLRDARQMTTQATTLKAENLAVSGSASVGGILTVGGCIGCGGGSGGGITNSAGANVVMKSNGVNAVASSMTDNGTTISTLIGFQAGPFGGNGGFHIDPLGNDNYFQPFASSYGFGFGVTNSIQSPIDITDDTFTPGTANPRTDNFPLLIRGLSSAHFDTTAAALDPAGMFFDMSPVKSAGSNRLSSVTLRLDNRGPDHATALWVDEGEISLATHIMFSVRPTSPTGSPPSISTCGTSPSVQGNDNGGRITVGSGTVNSCTVLFQWTWVDHTNTNIVPSCQVQSESGIALTYTPSATQLTITGTAMQSTFLDYKCSGADNAVPVIGP